MRYALALLAWGALLGGCAPQFGGRIAEVQPGVFSITHVMYANSPVKGVRQGVIDRAVGKCNKQNRSYQKLREEMGTQGVLSYTLFFQCNAGK